MHAVQRKELNRRQALIGAGAVVAAAALPSAAIATVVEPFWETASAASLDSIAAMWGIARFAVKTPADGVIPLESDSSLRARLLEVMQKSWR